MVECHERTTTTTTQNNHNKDISICGINYFIFSSLLLLFSGMFFVCGLRIDADQTRTQIDRMECFSFLRIYEDENNYTLCGYNLVTTTVTAAAAQIDRLEGAPKCTNLFIYSNNASINKCVCKFRVPFFLSWFEWNYLNADDRHICMNSILFTF